MYGVNKEGKKIKDTSRRKILFSWGKDVIACGNEPRKKV